MRRLLIPLVVLLAVAAASAAAQTTPMSQILSARLDGSDARSLSGPEPAAAIAVARRDGRILFARGGSGEAGYWVMNADGSEERALGVAPADGYYGPAWSPDGRTIGLTRWDESPCTPSSRNCAISELVLADAETGAVRGVVRSRDRGVGSLSWSPDGSRLAHAGSLDMDLGAHTIETIRSDGSGRRVVLRLPRGAWPGITNVAWSPRGDRLAYDRAGWIWTVRLQGGSSTRLARGWKPVWSPRGDKLLYVSWRDDAVSVIDIATRRVRVLARAPEVSLPAWSPDGRRVALELRTRGVSTLSVVRASDARRLHAWQPGGDVSSLFFTRDGARLVYTRLGS
jgi:Tol biopolymer transport system component